jgi:UDP-N-acetyl-2-amino-2-deoxyglucuronate dehydrogenase
MRHLRVGIIGCGVISSTHSEAFALQTGIKLKWACDLELEKAEKLAEKYGYTQTTANYKQVLADPDVDIISVCTDHASHASICVAALKAGKHVLCEKALSSTSRGIARILTAQRKHPKLVFSGVFQHRFDAANQYIKHLIDEDVFGTILTAGLRMYCKRTNEYYQADNWRGTWDKEGGGVMINQAIHYVDLLGWLMGGVERVCGAHSIRTHQGVIETEDTVTASLKFKSGALGVIEATSSSEETWHPAFWINGDSGWLEMCNGRVLRLQFSDKELEKKVKLGLAKCHDQPGVQTRKTYYGTGHTAQIEDFVNAIREKRPPFVSAVQAARAVDIVMAIYRSQQDSAWIKVPQRTD